MSKSAEYAAEYESFIKDFKEKFPSLYDAIKDDDELLEAVFCSKYTGEVVDNG